MVSTDPRWLMEARKHIGLTEIKGLNTILKSSSSGETSSAAALKMMKRRGARPLLAQC